MSGSELSLYHPRTPAPTIHTGQETATRSAAPYTSRVSDTRLKCKLVQASVAESTRTHRGIVQQETARRGRTKRGPQNVKTELSVFQKQRLPRASYRIYQGS